MGLEFEIRPLTSDDNRSTFTCGEPSLDRFFQHYAGQSQFKLSLSVTYVATASSEVLGFATVSAGTIERHEHPDAKVQKRLPAYSIPILRLARLGVSTRFQGLGIGRALLRHVFLIALEQQTKIGCLGVVTDAKTEAISFYESLGFIPLSGIREGRIHGESLPMFLDIRLLQEARE